jgi:hypothetical protein
MMLTPFSSPLRLARLFTVSLLYISSAHSSDYALHQGTLGLTYEPITIGNDESLGLLGLHALVSQGQYTYVGVSGFGAVTGERGGFLAGGYSAGLHVPLADRFTANLSIFLGGGGGGDAPQGGGLMVREQAGIDYNASGYKMGAGISHVYFPNGEIESAQPYLSLQIPFTTLYTSGWTAGELSPGTFSQPLYDRDASFALSYKHYRGGALFDKDIQPGIGISTIGVDWRHHVSDGYYYSLSTHGAYEGEAAGYAEVMAGAGSQWSLGQNTTLGLAMAIGSGGGGKVATGGGLLGAVTLNLEQKLSRQLFLSLQGGYTGARDGDFQGTVYGISLGTHYMTPVTTGWESAIASQPYLPGRYRLRIIQQRYYAGTTLRTNARVLNNRIDLSGLQIDKQMGDYFYLTGQGVAAWHGDAGGYASGMLGGGLSLPLSPHIALHGELLAGAAGGGNVDVGDGLLLGGTVSAIVNLSDSLDLELGTGRISAYDGGLDGRQVTLAIGYRFTHPVR